MIKKFEEFNEDLSISNATRISKENFYDKDSKYRSENFNEREINQIKSFIDGSSNISIQFQNRNHIRNVLILETETHYIIIKKLEDEWFLLEERLKSGSRIWGKVQSKAKERWGEGYHIVDRFDQLMELLQSLSVVNEAGHGWGKGGKTRFVTNHGDDGPINLKTIRTEGHTPYHVAYLSSKKAVCKFAKPLNLQNLSVISFTPSGPFYSFEDVKDKKIAYIFDIEIDDLDTQDKFISKLLKYLKISGMEMLIMDIMSDDPYMKLIKKFGFDYLYGEEERGSAYESRMYLNL